jgi:hypothetical protein
MRHKLVLVAALAALASLPRGNGFLKPDVWVSIVCADLSGNR